jgi:hypothetical protein
MHCNHRGKETPRIKVACTGIDGVEIFRRAYRCEIHNYCIVNYNPEGHILERWDSKEEAESFKLCRQCSEHSSVSHNDNSEK